MSRGLLMMGGHKAAEFVGATNSNGFTAGSPLTWPSGTIAGDLAILHGMQVPVTNSTPPTLTGWTVSVQALTGFGFWSFTAYKHLSGGDISSPPNGPDAAWFFVNAIYRGPSALSLKSSQDNTNDTSESVWTVTGFTPILDSYGALVTCIDRASTLNTILNSGARTRVSAAGAGAGIVFGDIDIYDGSNVDVGSTISPYGRAGQIWEMT